MCQEARATETKPGNGGTEILKKPLDKRHKMCYNEYVRWGTPTAKTTKNRGNRHDAKCIQESRLLGSAVRLRSGDRNKAEK